MPSDSFVTRGIGFRVWVFRKLVEVAEGRKVSVSRLVNEAVIAFFDKELAGEEVEKFHLLAERDRLLADNQDHFLMMKRLLRDGAYVNDAAKSVLLGDENFYERWQKRAEGVYNRLTKEELDVLLRLFAAREKNTKRIVEIECQLLPEERLKMDLVEQGWRLPGKRRMKNS